MKIGKLCSAFAYLQENAFTRLHLADFYGGFVHDFVFFVFTFVTLIRIKE